MFVLNTCQTLPCSNICKENVESGSAINCAGLKPGINKCVSVHKRADQKQGSSTRREAMTADIKKKIIPIKVSTQPQAVQENYTPYFVADAGIGFPLPNTAQQIQQATG